MDALQPFDSNACNRHLANALLAKRRGREPVEVFRLRPSSGPGRSDKRPARWRWATGRATASTEMPVHIMKCSHAAGRAQEWATDNLIPDTQPIGLTAASVLRGQRHVQNTLECVNNPGRYAAHIAVHLLQSVPGWSR